MVERPLARWASFSPYVWTSPGVRGRSVICPCRVGGAGVAPHVVILAINTITESKSDVLLIAVIIFIVHESLKCRGNVHPEVSRTVRFLVFRHPVVQKSSFRTNPE